jgi:uncharacterized damage-inducible protein DinB
LVVSKGMLLEEALESWGDARGLVVGEAENIPAERYSFRPTPEVRSVGEMFAHILEVSEMMVGELCRPDGDFRRKPFGQLIREHAAKVSSLREKDELLAALHDTLEEGSRRFREAGEPHLLGPIRRFDGLKASRLSWMHHGIAQEMYHGGQLATYVRLMGLVPALTKRIRGE